MKKATNRARSLRPWVLAAAMLVSAASAFGAAAVQRSVALGAVSDTDAVKAVISGALRLNESITTPPAAYQSGSGMAKAISESDIRSMVDGVPGQLGQYYTGARLNQLIPVVEGHAHEQVFPGADRQLPGVVQEINFQTVRVDGDAATAIVTDLQWRNFIHYDAEGKPGIILSPHHHLTWTFGLVHTSDGWRITSDYFAFAPGEGP